MCKLCSIQFYVVFMVFCSKHYRENTEITTLILFEMKIALVIAGHILTLILYYVSGKRQATLTTSVYRDDFISVKPTPLHRRIAVDINAGIRLSTSSEIFHKRDTIRRSNSDIWSWDYWCRLQPLKGNCSKHYQKFYYNSLLDRCELFTYSGCHGNMNKFETEIDCQRYCKGAAYMDLQNVSTATACALQPNVGLCFALFYKYYYDVNDRKCKAFAYSGCGGNQNRFSTKRKCLKKCTKEDLFDEK